MTPATETPSQHTTGTLRILVGKLGLDGHDMGARLVARLLRDQGYEVIYGGLHGTPESMAAAARDEGVDVIGLSFLSGGQVERCTDLLAAMQRAGIGEIPVVVGGVILPDDAAQLREMGIADVFPSTDADERFFEYFRTLASQAT